MVLRGNGATLNEGLAVCTGVLDPALRGGGNVTVGGAERQGGSNCHHPFGGGWLLGKECFEKLLRVGEEPSSNTPKTATICQSLPLPELWLMNWRFFLLRNGVLYKIHVQ